jgi:parallel beta-helix repeat protein
MNKLASPAIISLLITLSVVFSVYNVQHVEAASKMVYVDDDNVSGPWDGTLQYPYQNITSGLEHTAVNDTIFVYNGTYYETIYLNKSISLIGENKYGTIIDGNFTGNVVAISADYVNISNFTICNARQVVDPNHHGVILENSTNCIISNNIMANSFYGVLLNESSNNTIADNQVFCMPHWLGIALYHSSNYNTLTNNTISSGYMPLLLSSSSHNLLNSNEVYSGTYGIRLADSMNNTIIANQVFNSSIGIYIASYHSPGSSNLVYHNNLLNNTETFQAGESNSTNIWDNGYPSGGNYWCDYNGTDLFSGPYQNETGGDEIGDTPYIIPYLNNSDTYPLIKPYDTQHDIGITNTKPSKTVVGQGYSLNINIRLVNYGVNTETFNVTAYANTTLIQTETITLTSRNCTTITFTWDTTGFVKGNYTITTTATSLLGETDTTDNTCTDGWVFITIPGDIDADKDVDLYDAVALLVRYGAKQDETSYNPNCDIDNDGQIFLFDAVILLGNYGQKDT